MIKKLSRKHTAIGISILAIIILIGYGISTQWDRLTNPYFGLKTYLDVQMTPETRTLVEQKVATAKASILASEKSGGEVDNTMYLTIAENEKILGDLIASRQMYEKYLTINDSSYVAWNSYAKLLEYMNDLTKSEEAYKKTLTLLKDESYYRDYYDFLILHFPARLTDIKALLDEAFKTLGQTPWTMVALGDWNFTTGDCEQGKAHYDVAKTLSGNTATQALLQQDEDEKFAECKKK